MTSILRIQYLGLTMLPNRIQYRHLQAMPHLLARRIRTKIARSRARPRARLRPHRNPALPIHGAGGEANSLVEALEGLDYMG